MSPRKQAAKKSAARKSAPRRQSGESGGTREVEQVQFAMNRSVRLPGGTVVRADAEDAEDQLRGYSDEEGNGIDMDRLKEKGVFEQKPLARRYNTAVRGDSRRIRSTVVEEVDNPREPQDESRHFTALGEEEQPDQGEQVSGEE